MSDPLVVDDVAPVELVLEKDQSDDIVSTVSTGFVSENDRKHLYHAAEPLLFPSFNEGFGLPALGAFACAKPVVTSRTRTDHSEAGGQDTPDQERPT
jgi:glycosyltransferase involved in cell wall biosynthesis